MNLRKKVRDYEEGLIQDVLWSTGGNLTEAAKKMQILRVTLTAKVRNSKELKKFLRMVRRDHKYTFVKEING